MARLKTVLFVTAGLAAVFWGVGPFLPTGYWLEPHPTPTEAIVALTFDDGPNPIYTPRVLRILQEHGVKATFFVIGAGADRHRELVKQMVQEGHEVGNHSQSHQWWLPFLLPNQIGQDFRRSQETIRDITGTAPQFYRAPHGRISPWMGFALHRQGARIVRWDVSAKDWKNPRADEVVQRILDRVRPGSIILLHDGLGLNDQVNRDVVVNALPRLIEGLQTQGYRFVTLGELFGAGSP